MTRMAMKSLLVLSALLCGVAGVRMNRNTAGEVSQTAHELSWWEPKIQAVKLKVGDKAKVLIENGRQEYTSLRTGTKGMIGVIIQDDKSDVPFQVEFSDGRKLWYKEKWLGDVPDNHADWLAAIALEPNASCGAIDGAKSRNSKPFPDCKCESYRHEIYCRGKRLDGRKFNLTHIARDITDCHVTAKCAEKPVCEDIEGAESRKSKEYPYCKCKEEAEQVFCGESVLDNHKFKADWVWRFCAQPRCAVKGHVCEDVEGAESRESEDYPQCKCKEDDHKVKCNEKVVADRKFKADEVLEICEKPRCVVSKEPVCEDIEGAESRESKDYPHCKCKEDAAQVKCNETVVATRKFQADEVLGNCTKPRCVVSKEPSCEDIEGAESRTSKDYPSCKCKEVAHKVKCEDAVVAARKFKADYVLGVCTKPRCA